ncbi:HAD family hydrolase [Halarcobacter ebronensis]|uniref:phosphoglycolate phosphatase n=1 Tax=Halarcobacter ebronensis TaxID=1462615 RepID=A0A4Q1AND2_9BACT|nr:HAD family phosphatase [Halarcobacter ebronensis]QKF81608.1 beta-phosphoglucomutase-like HAD superfamily hydrolase [Halarcobacter ebronensis]RXK05536.1 HAD family hydrolase [Halarcobacter ebronensis]
MKKFILFDNDGVLVETEPLYFEASKKALKEFFDVKLHFDQYMDIMTEGNGVWVAAPNATKEEIIRARNQRDIYYQEYLKKEDIAIDNIHDILNALSKNYRMGIVTTSRRVDFEIIHNNRGVTNFMDFVLCVEDYKRAKPYPDPYLKGLKLFNAQKDETVVVEDSQRGLISANSADIDCIIVHNEFTKTQDFSTAKHKIGSLKELIDFLPTL